MSGAYDEPEHWQKAHSDNLWPFSRKVDPVGMLSTGENKNILLTPGESTILSTGVGTTKIEIWKLSVAGSSYGIILSQEFSAC